MPRPVLLVAGLLAAGAVTAAPAAAATTPPLGFLPGASAPAAIDAGVTTVTLAPRVVRALGAAGISVRPAAPAVADGAALAIPIQGGRLDADSGAGRLTHTGGLTIARGPRQVRLTELGITAGRGTSTLDARVNGRFRLPILRLVTQRATVDSTATTTSISGLAVHLSTLGAVALNRALHTRTFRPAVRLGSAAIRAQRAQVAFAGGTTSLSLDPAAGAALAGLGIEVAPLAPASTTPEGALAFPIAGGAVRTRDLAGQVRHLGGLSLTSEDGFALEATDPVVDTTRDVLTAVVGGGRVDFLALDRSAAAVMVMGDAVTVANVGASLTAPAAAALNDAFATSAFTPGLRLGTASVNGQSR